VTCNVGARQLAMPDFADTVLAAIAEAGLPTEQLCLDITEPALRYNGSSTWSALRRLKEVGVKLGLDDFGTGAASLGALRDLSLDLIRIDRLFIADLAMSAEDQAIVRHVTNLAHELGVVSVAEGVETPEQAAVLTTLVPGLQADDLTINILDDVVSIEGESNQDETEYLMRELPSGKFRRSLRLPAAVDPDKAEAKITDGVLTLRLPKAESSLPKKIKIAVQ
jgi:HSP20 family molecular chaperone IbpA